MNKYIIALLFVFQYGFSNNNIDSLIIQRLNLNSTHYKNDFNSLEFEQEEHEYEAECDACGCSASGGSMGFASMINTNFIGIRYFNQSYKSTDGLYSNSEWYDESFNTIQVWARIPVSKKLQVNALIPYQFHNRQTETGKQSINGLGDVTLLGMHRLYQTKKDSTKVFYHTVQAGAGIKLPVGKFSDENSGSFNPSYQVGTGSFDFLFASEYVLRYKKFGFNNMVNYVLKTENDKNYKFGNQLNYAGTFFYAYENKKYSLAPQIGFAAEVYEENNQLGQRVRNTAGNALFGKAGFEVGKDKFSMGANFMLPISQNLNGGNLEANTRWTVNINYRL